jgi:hypothetical protein
MKTLNSVFIVGMPRSGTTLLSNLLNATNQIYFGEETHFFEVLKKWTVSNRSIDFLDFFLNNKRDTNKHLKYLRLSEKNKEYIFKKRDEINANPYFLLEVICSLKRNENISIIWGEKTPTHFLFLDEIYDNYKGVKVIQIVRDPRDVYLSQVKIDWGIKNPLTFASLYKKSVRGLKLNLKSSNYLYLKFEDLLSNPSKEMKTVCEFLSINYSKDILQKFSSSENMNFDLKLENWKINNSNEFNQNNFGKWKNHKDDIEIKFISQLLNEELNYFEYDCSEKKSIFLFVYAIFFYLSSLLEKVKMRIK